MFSPVPFCTHKLCSPMTESDYEVGNQKSKGFLPPTWNFRHTCTQNKIVIVTPNHMGKGLYKIQNHFICLCLLFKTYQSYLQCCWPVVSFKITDFGIHADSRQECFLTHIHVHTRARDTVLFLFETFNWSILHTDIINLG